MGAKEALRQAALEKPSARWLVVDDAVFATSDFFFHDGDDCPVAMVGEDHDGVGYWVFLDKADVERRHRSIRKGACDEARCRHAP
jgi:hypothetical protein